MEIEKVFDSIYDAILAQQQVLTETGILPPLTIDGISLTLDPNDPPEVRRRVIYYRAKLREWRLLTLSQKEQLAHARFISTANIEAILEDLL